MSKANIIMAVAIAALGASNLYLLAQVRAIDAYAYESATKLADRLSAAEAQIQALQPEPSTLASIAQQAELDRRAAEAGTDELFEQYRAEDEAAKRGQ